MESRHQCFLLGDLGINAAPHGGQLVIVPTSRVIGKMNRRSLVQGWQMEIAQYMILVLPLWPSSAPLPMLCPHPQRFADSAEEAQCSSGGSGGPRVLPALLEFSEALGSPMPGDKPRQQNWLEMATTFCHCAARLPAVWGTLKKEHLSDSGKSGRVGGKNRTN